MAMFKKYCKWRSAAEFGKPEPFAASKKCLSERIKMKSKSISEHSGYFLPLVAEIGNMQTDMKVGGLVVLHKPFKSSKPML